MFKRYEADEQVIFHGDSLPILSSEIASNSVDLIFLDPPYNIGKHFADFYDKWESENDYINWANQILDQCLRILKPQGTLYVMASTQAMPYFDLYLRQKMTILSRIIWHYDFRSTSNKILWFDV